MFPPDCRINRWRCGGQSEPCAFACPEASAAGALDSGLRKLAENRSDGTEKRWREAAATILAHCRLGGFEPKILVRGATAADAYGVS